jgi:TonB-linked SusC/RagA family outer membrane protein
VVTERGDPLGGATVIIANTNFGASTSPSGAYTITIEASAARGQQVVLTARYLGYRATTRTVVLSPGSQEQNFELRPDPLRLDELIVTGVSEATSAKKLTFSVGKVSEERLQEVPGGSALQALQGKVAGVRLVPTSAQPGGEVALRLRGATSIGGRQDPLFIVDGVITPYGLADVAAEDIERIEVIKGAAASSLYGSNGANGVVQVFTRRGANLPDGAMKVTARFEGGVNQMPRRLEFSRSHSFEVDGSGNYVLSSTGARITKANQIADNAFPVYLDHWNAVVDEGVFWTGYFSVGQRRGTTNLNASLQNTENKGVIFGLDGYSRQNFRVNVDQQLAQDLDVSFSTFYGKSTNGRTAEGQTGPFFGLMFLQPDVDILAPNDDGTPYRAQVPLSGDIANDFNPLYELANRKISQNRNRFTGSARARWRMMDWLSADASVGYDQESQDYSDLTPFGFLTSSNTKTEGSLYKESRNGRQINTGVSLTAINTFGMITNTTRIATTYEDELNRLLVSTASKLLVKQVPEFGGSDPASQRARSNEETIKTNNYFAITTFDINDRFIVDGLIRRDGSSLFGPESRWATYYRLSGAWRANEDLKISGVDELRFRASYGTAGLRPGFDNQYEVLQVTAGGFSKETLGNPLLKPAKSAELELGTNLEFGNGRFSFEYNYAQKTTSDQILLVDLPAVAGFKQQWQNTGVLKSKTHEVAFSAQLLNTRSTALVLNIVGDRTRQVITEWNLPQRLYSFQQMPAAFFLGTNSSLGALYGTRWIRNIEDLYADPAKAALRGPGQAHDPNNYMTNEDGYVVLKSAYGTLNERAIKYTFCKREDASGGCAETSQVTQIGDANPDFNLSFGGTLSHKRFVVNALLDWSQGGDLYNGTRQWAFQATRDAAQDQGGKPANDAACGTAAAATASCPRKPLGYYAVGFYNGLDPSDYFVEDGSYAKLKELSLNYTFVRNQLQSIGLGGLNELRIGLIARNLFTITNYSGLDPEVSGLFGDPFQVRMDWFQYPQFRTYTAVVEIAF